MKVSKKDIYLIIGFLGVLAFLCAFLWVYQPTMEKVDALKAESRSLEIEIADLQSKMDNKDTYVSKTQEMATEMDSILQMFPVELKEEDAIVLTLTEELLSPMIVTTLTKQNRWTSSFIRRNPKRQNRSIQEKRYSLDFTGIQFPCSLFQATRP